VYKVASIDNYTNNYNENKGVKGDAVYETSSSAGAWNGDYSYFPCSSGPVFLRGGGYNGGSNAGAFFFNYTSGNGNSTFSFHPVLAF
jgi:hypothetical protein